MQPGQVRGMQVPSSYHLLFVHSGETFLSRGDSPATNVPAGNAILLRPQDLSHRRTIGTAPSRQTWVALVPDALSAEQLALLDAAPDAQPLSPGLDAVQESILDIAWQLQAPAEPSAEAVLMPLIAGALALYVEEARRAGRFDPDAQLHPAVQAARETARRRFNEPIGLRDLAAAGHVSPEHLVRLFRQELDTTPGRYLWAERVRAGVHLLEHSSVPIAEVALCAGFQTASHFSRTVRRMTGLRPGALRRQRQHSLAATEETVFDALSLPVSSVPSVRSTPPGRFSAGPI
jgi:AraC family transcriptional regulator, arabinose operon regulatory protein